MNKAIKKIYDACKASKDENGVARIAAKDLAKLVKVKLAEVFPGVKFSVTSDYNCVDVSWTDGPCSSAVDQVIGQYSFGGFDGMIDMAYSSKNWLFPDGSMGGAASDGTQGSMGVVPSYATDQPEAGAVLVSSGVKYVHGHHDHSDERMLELCESVAAKHGYAINYDAKLYNQTIDGEYLTTLAMKYETQAWRDSRTDGLYAHH